MQGQVTLVDVLGKFYPVIVQMDGSDPRKSGREKMKLQESNYFVTALSL